MSAGSNGSATIAARCVVCATVRSVELRDPDLPALVWVPIDVGLFPDLPVVVYSSSDHTLS